MSPGTVPTPECEPDLARGELVVTHELCKSIRRQIEIQDMGYMWGTGMCPLIHIAYNAYGSQRKTTTKKCSICPLDAVQRNAARREISSGLNEGEDET